MNERNRQFLQISLWHFPESVLENRIAREGGRKMHVVKQGGAKKHKREENTGKKELGRRLLQSEGETA